MNQRTKCRQQFRTRQAEPVYEADYRERAAQPHPTTVRFELLSTLQKGSSTMAALRMYVGGELVTKDSSTLTVYDRLGTFEGNAGDYGYAAYMPDARQWEVIQLQCMGG